MKICLQLLFAETLKTIFSEKGSLYRPAEEQAYVNYVDFLDECEGTNIIILSVVLLLFLF